MVLCNKLKKLTYEDQIKVIYQEYGYIRGEYLRTIKGKDYVITLLPKTPEENLIRWEYYLEQEAQKWSTRWIEPKTINLNRSPDIEKAIQLLLAENQQGVNSSYLIKRGYEYGFTRSSLGWLNKSPLAYDHRETLRDMIRGLGMFYVEQRLKEMLPASEPEEVESDLPMMDSLSDKQRIVLAHELGIIQHLRSIDWFNHKKRNLSNVLCLLFGIDLNTATAESILEDIKKMDAGDPTKSPINDKNTGKVKSYLSALGMNLKDIEKLKK